MLEYVCMYIFVQYGWKDVNSVICVQPPPNFYETWACTMCQGWLYLFIPSCSFPLWGSIDSVILCECAPSRRVSGCPSTKFGVRIPLKTQTLPATTDITLHLWLVHFPRTPCQFSHSLHTLCVLLVNLIIEYYAEHLLGGYLLLPADSYRIGAQCIHVFLLVHHSKYSILFLL
jgi:hypothetical protein